MNVLLLFARRLKRGQVKTRLAAGLGEDEALSAYREMVAGAAQLAREPEWRTVWVLTGEGEWDWEGPWWEQEALDLGGRMRVASDRAFAEGAQRVIVAGTDVPALSAEHISRMFEALSGDFDWVHVPVLDGGYGAVGMRVPCGTHFDGRAWSHAGVYRTEIALAMRRGERILALPCLADVDDEADWKRWKAAEGHSN